VVFEHPFENFFYVNKQQKIELNSLFVRFFYFTLDIYNEIQATHENEMYTFLFFVLIV